MTLFENIIDGLINEAINPQEAYKFYNMIPEEIYNRIVGGSKKITTPIKLALEAVKNGEVDGERAAETMEAYRNMGAAEKQYITTLFNDGEYESFEDFEEDVKDENFRPVKTPKELIGKGLIKLGEDEHTKITCTTTYAANNHFYGASRWCTASDRNGNYDGFSMFRKYTGTKDGYTPDNIYALIQIVNKDDNSKTCQISINTEGEIDEACNWNDRQIDKEDYIVTVFGEDILAFIKNPEVLEKCVAGTIENIEDENYYWERKLSRVDRKAERLIRRVESRRNELQTRWDNEAAYSFTEYITRAKKNPQMLLSDPGKDSIGKYVDIQREDLGNGLIGVNVIMMEPKTFVVDDFDLEMDLTEYHEMSEDKYYASREPEDYNYNEQIATTPNTVFILDEDGNALNVIPLLAGTISKMSLETINGVEGLFLSQGKYFIGVYVLSSGQLIRVGDTGYGGYQILPFNVQGCICVGQTNDNVDDDEGTVVRRFKMINLATGNVVEEFNYWQSLIPLEYYGFNGEYDEFLAYHKNAILTVQDKSNQSHIIQMDGTTSEVPNGYKLLSGRDNYSDIHFAYQNGFIIWTVEENTNTDLMDARCNVSFVNNPSEMVFGFDGRIILTGLEEGFEGLNFIGSRQFFWDKDKSKRVFYIIEPKVYGILKDGFMLKHVKRGLISMDNFNEFFYPCDRNGVTQIEKNMKKNFANWKGHSPEVKSQMDKMWADHTPKEPSMDDISNIMAKQDKIEKRDNAAMTRMNNTFFGEKPETFLDSRDKVRWNPTMNDYEDWDEDDENVRTADDALNESSNTFKNTLRIIDELLKK